MRPVYASPLVFLGALALAACATPEPDPAAVDPAPAEVATPGLVTPDLITAADSLAMFAFEHAGGPDAWARVGALRFDFAVEREGERVPVRHHLWDRATGAYRIDWSNGDTLYTALFDVDDYTTGTVYMDGVPLPDSTQAEALDNAERAYLNDTYWLLTPIKLFDEGVTRSIDADSSDATAAALKLTFDGVGITPGDLYWIYVNRDTGAVVRWTFQLESGGIGQNDWSGYETFDTEAGAVRLATRKARTGNFAVLTDALGLPSDLDPAVFADPALRIDGLPAGQTPTPER